MLVVVVLLRAAVAVVTRLRLPVESDQQQEESEARSPDRQLFGSPKRGDLQSWARTSGKGSIQRTAVDMRPLLRTSALTWFVGPLMESSIFLVADCLQCAATGGTQAFYRAACVGLSQSWA